MPAPEQPVGGDDIFMPWARPEQLEESHATGEDSFTKNTRAGNDVSITIIREGDVETT